MAEPLRKEEQLTTADLASRRAVDRAQTDEFAEDVNRPKPVSSETTGTWEQRTPPGEQRAAIPEHRVVTQRMGDTGATSTPLFAETDINELRTRWSSVQAGFVDEPRHAVEEADKLVAAVMERLAQGFANERSSLERQWGSGDQVSTEDLRIALQRYRSFFDRLLNA